MKKILIEASVLEQDQPSGVNYFAYGLAKSLTTVSRDSLNVGYLWLNFLGKKQAKNPLVQAAAKLNLLRQFRLLPQRVYAKLVFAHIAPPLLLSGVDWVLFPNFYIWPILGKAKKAVIIHDLCYLRYPDYVEDKNREFLNTVATRSIKQADLVISNSNFTTSELITLTNTSADKIVTLSIPVDSSQFEEKDNLGMERLRERYGVTKKYILSLGTLEPRKNLDMLVEAYCLLPENIRDEYSLLLVGKWGWKIDSLRELIAKKQAAGFDIITTGHADHGDKATFFKNASYYAITTHYEGFGMPLLEALHCGIPTVAVDIPVLREVGGDACLWANKETNDIAQKLELLISDKALASQYARLATQQAATFSWDDVAIKLRDALLRNS